jgi:hypothetical protein
MARVINPDPDFKSRPQIDPEKVFFVITKLREFQAKEEDIPTLYSESEDASNAVDDGMREVLADSPDDLVLAELRSFLRALNVDERATLVALVYIGRGDFAATEWDGAFNEAKQADLRTAMRVLIGSPHASDYLDNTMGVYGETFDEYERKHL